MAARHRRRRIRTGRSRFGLSRVLMSCAVVLALAYFSFTRVMFDPFEDAQPSFTRLSPRDVDLFVQREALASDFDVSGSLPMPRVWAALRRTPEWKLLSSNTWWRSLAWPQDLERAFAELPAQLSQLPLDPLQHVLGQEVVLLGRDLAGAGHWALLARLSTRAKLAVEMFGFDGVLQEALPGAVREMRHDEEMPEVRYACVAPADAAPFFYAREADLLVLGGDEQLVRDVLRLVHGGSEQALGLSRLYDEHMPPPSAAAEHHFSAGFTVRLGKLLAAWELLPDSELQHDDALLNLLLRLVDTRLIDDSIGRLELQPGAASLQLHAEIDVGLAAADEGGLLGADSFSVHEHLGQVLGGLPRDVVAAVCMNVSLRRFLTTVSGSFSPEVRQLLDNTLREVAATTAGWQIDTLPELIAELGRVLGGELSLVVRPVDHELPPGSQPLPAMVLIAPILDAKALHDLEEVFLRAHALFGVGDDELMEKEEGVGSRRWLMLDNLPMEEIAYIMLDDETFMISTDNDLLEELVQIYTGAPGSLGATPEVSGLLQEFQRPGPLDARANLAGWFSAKGLLAVLKPYATYVAEQETVLDFGVERARQRDALISRQHPEYRGREAELPEDLSAALDQELDRLIDQAEQERLDVTVPRLAQEWLERRQWLLLLDQAALGLRMGDRSMDFELRLRAVGR